MTDTTETQSWSQPVANTDQLPAGTTATTAEPPKVEPKTDTTTPAPSVTESKEYKTLQTKLNRANEELAKARSSNSSLATIEQRTQKVEQLMDLLVESLSHQAPDDEEPPPKSNIRQRYESIKNSKAQSGEPTDEAYSTIKDLVTGAGMGMDDPKLEYAQYLYGRGRFVSAVEEVRKLVSGKVEPVSKESPEQEKTRLKAELRAEILKELGANSVDGATGGGGGGRTFTRQELARMTPEEYAQNREAVAAAYRGGRIK